MCPCVAAAPCPSPRPNEHVMIMSGESSSRGATPTSPSALSTVSWHPLQLLGTLAPIPPHGLCSNALPWCCLCRRDSGSNPTAPPVVDSKIHSPDRVLVAAAVRRAARRPRLVGNIKDTAAYVWPSICIHLHLANKVLRAGKYAHASCTVHAAALDPGLAGQGQHVSSDVPSRSEKRDLGLPSAVYIRVDCAKHSSTPYPYQVRVTAPSIVIVVLRLPVTRT